MNFLLHHDLERWSDDEPDRTAVEDGGRSSTFGDLERRANRVASVLQGLGVRVGDRVGLWLPRSIDAIAAYHGVLKLGAICVPLDDRAHAPRVSAIASDCAIGAFIVDDARADAMEELLDNGVPLTSAVVMGGRQPAATSRLDVVGESAIESASDRRPPDRVIDQDPAVIIYTSGSTGVPKGVVMSHAAARHSGEVTVELAGFRSDDRFCQNAPLSYVASLTEVFGPLHAGATIVVAPPNLSAMPGDFTRFLADERITRFFGVSSMLALLVESGSLAALPLPSLRGVMFGGEPMSGPHLRRLVDALPGVALGNGYGSTEASYCLYQPVPRPLPDDFARLPAGRAVPNTEVIVVTDDGRPAGPGERGELMVRGRGVMLGYWNRPEDTAAVLRPHPLDARCLDRVFVTGDQAEVGADGELTIIGRLDHQVKTRGTRVELGEVEAAVEAHPDVAECSVVAVDDEVFTNRLVAHVVGRAGLTAGQLARWCRDRLVPAMVPAEFHLHDQLPRTASGKVDRQSLSARSDTR